MLEDRTLPAVFNVGPGDVATLIKDMNHLTNGSLDSTNVIDLTKSTYDLTTINNYWYGPNGLPPIYSQNLIIHGNGAVIQRDPAAPDFRLFYVSGGMELQPGSLTLDNVTLQGGIAKGGDSTYGGGGAGSEVGDTAGIGGFGGGDGSIGVAGGGGAGLGGAIFNMGADSAILGSGQATLVNCTLTADGAQGGSGSAGGDGFGGALFNLDGTVTLTNDTLDANTVAGTGTNPGVAHGGAVYNLVFGHDIVTGNAVTASLVLNNSILANSIGLNGRPIVGASDDLDSETGATVNGSNNLVTSSRSSIPSGVITLTANPQLGLLQNNGGLAPTLLPSSGSPVLGAGSPGLAPSADQRGQSRPPNGPTDLGSVQVSIATSGGGSSSGSGSASGGGSSSGGGATLADFVGLAIEEFDLVVDQILADIEGLLNRPHSDLDATIVQLQMAIGNDPLTPTPTGQMAVQLGESLALSALGGR